MAGKFDNTREKAETPEDMSGFDLDSELAGLTSFLQEMGVDLENETSAGNETTDGDGASVGDEITGSIFFDFAGEGDTVSEDVLERLLFGEEGIEGLGSENKISGKGAGNTGGSDDKAGANDAATAYDMGAVTAHPDTYDMGAVTARPDTYDIGGVNARPDTYDMGGVSARPDTYDMGGVSTRPDTYDMDGVSVPPDMYGMYGKNDTEDAYDVSDVSHAVDSYDVDAEDDTDDMYHLDGLPDEDDAYDLGDINGTYNDPDDAGGADGADAGEFADDAGTAGVANAAGTADGANAADVTDQTKADAKSSKKVEKEVDKVLRKTFGRPFSWKREVLSWAAMFIFAFTLAFVIDNLLIVNATVPTGSMQNTIMAGDRMIGWRLSYLFSEPERGDIIIFEYPDDPEEIYVKRIIGLPGETVTITDGKIYINDSTEPLEEDYLPEEWVWKNDGFTFVVPEDSYLCLGDNRNNSHDARSWTNTYVTKDAILGQAILIYWPTEDFHWLN